MLAAVTGVAASVLAGFLGAYSSQSWVIGLLSVASLLPFLLLSEGGRDLNIVAAIIAALVGLGVAVYGSRLSLPTEDMEKGRLFGVRWTHWLWLLLPWQGAVANIVWLGLPPSLSGTGNLSAWTVLGELLETPVMLALVAFSTIKALESIRQDAPWSRLSSAMRFLGWFLLLPIGANLLRLLGFL